MNPGQYWHKVDGNNVAPRSVPLDVCGASGYFAQPWFLCNAILSEDGVWYGADMEPLRDRGWIPLYWRRQSVFPNLALPR